MKTQDGKIKILRIIARLNIGGPARHAVLLSGGLDKARFETTLVYGPVGKDEGDMSYLASGGSFETVEISSLGRELSLKDDILAFWRLIRLMLAKRPQIVHTHTAKAGSLGRVAAFLTGVPVRIHTFHGHVLSGYFSPRKTGFFLTIERSLAWITDRIVAVSEGQRDELVNNFRLCRREKCVVIPLGFETGPLLRCERLKGEFKRSLGLGPGTKLVGIIGRFVPIKDHKMFLDAASILVKDGARSNARFILAGDGALKAELEDYAKRLGIDGVVIFTGWVKGLEQLYADLDVVGLTSRNEGTPVSLIEAMLAARPVVATSVGGVADIVHDGENGFLVRPGDAGEFARKIAGLLDDDRLRADMGAKARAFAGKIFTKERLIGDVESLYEEVLSKKGVKI